MKAVFLGTNGWFDTETGRTPSILLDTSKAYIILDAGFGIAKVDKYILEDKPVYLFITHFHLDHICGLHTLPKFNFKHGLKILFPEKMMKYFKIFLEHPFAMPMKEMRYKIDAVGLKEGEHTKPFKFVCKKLQHADLTYGYRMYLDDKIVTYCSDTAVCDNDYLLAKDSDLLIHECAFVQEKKSKWLEEWGHTGPSGAAKLAKKANVKKLALTHFGANGYWNLDIRKNAGMTAKKIFPNSVAATDELILEI